MKIGFAMCGSYCTYSQVFPVMEQLAKEYELLPIFSNNAYATDSRFGTAQAHIRKAFEICGVDPIHTIAQAAAHRHISQDLQADVAAAHQ